MAGMLDLDVLLCDPREEYAATHGIEGLRRVEGMPDDVVRGRLRGGRSDAAGAPRLQRVQHHPHAGRHRAHGGRFT